MEGPDGDIKRKGSSSDKNNNNENGRSVEKYGLRPRTAIKRLQHDFPVQEVTKRSSGRSKSRPAPLSKYRRKTANARERHRMKAINTAFESLRKVLPDAVEVQTASSTMTKITTLRLAVDYIRALSDVLEDDSDSNFTLQPQQESSFHSSLHSNAASAYTSQHLPPITAPYTVPITLRQNNNLAPSSTLALHYKNGVHAQYAPHLSQLMSYCSTSSNMSTSSSPCTSRGSLGSTSDLEELLSDDSGLLEDNLDVFHDIPTITLADPFEVLLGTEKEGLHFASEF